MGQFGLFHFLVCITRCMRSDHPDFWQVLQGLQNCLYHYNGEDEKRVIQALADGTMNGKKHSEEEIGEVKDSSKWDRCYYAFLQKLSTPFEVERIEMQKWWNRNKVEGGSGRLHNGYSVFLPGT
jgi:hypothetical protein